MIGVVVVTHKDIGKTMIATMKRIIPDPAITIENVPIESDLPPEVSHQQISEAIKKVDHGDGVILLADMFGGTPSNLCIPFLKKGEVEVISGFNLPMLIKLAGLSNRKNFSELVTYINNYGKKNIVIASEVLDGKVEY